MTITEWEVVWDGQLPRGHLSPSLLSQPPVGNAQLGWLPLCLASTRDPREEWGNRAKIVKRSFGKDRRKNRRVEQGVLSSTG